MQNSNSARAETLSKPIKDKRVFANMEPEKFTNYDNSAHFCSLSRTLVGTFRYI